MAASNGATRVDPVWLHGLPPPHRAAHDWIAKVSSSLPSSLDFQLPAILPALLSHGLSLHHSQPGHLLCTLLVTPKLANRYKTLHGGAIGSLVEMLGCAAIKSVAGPKDGMVTDINISYISGSPIEEEVEFEAKVLRLHENVGVATVDVRNKKTRKAAAQGRVTMCFRQASKL